MPKMEDLQDYDLNAVFKIKLRLNNGEIKYHEFNADILTDRLLDNLFEAIDEKLEEIYGQQKVRSRDTLNAQ